MLSTEDRDGVVVAHVTGEVDLANAARLGRALARAIPNDAMGVVIDLSSTTMYTRVAISRRSSERISRERRAIATAGPCPSIT